MSDIFLIKKTIFDVRVVNGGYLRIEAFSPHDESNIIMQAASDLLIKFVELEKPHLKDAQA
jgi:hypothetical protein